LRTKFFIFIILLLNLAGCSLIKEYSGYNYFQEKLQKNYPPNDFIISWGVAGGYNGLFQGYMIAADHNKIYKWEGKYSEEKTEIYQKIKKSELKKIWEKVQEIKQIKSKVLKPGYRTFYMKIYYNSQPIIFLWDADSNDNLSIKLNQLRVLLDDIVIDQKPWYLKYLRK